MPRVGNKEKSKAQKRITVSFKPKEYELINKLDSLRVGFEQDLGIDLGVSGTIKKLIQDY